MIGLILNSGLGRRMGVLTSEHPKCMTEISLDDTILSRGLRAMCALGIKRVVITTGYFDEVLVNYCRSLELPLEYSFVKNPRCAETNYIYSIYLARELLHDDILLLHGDLVFELSVAENMLALPTSAMAVSKSLPIPEKDFKARIEEGKITRVAVDIDRNCVAAEPLYKLNKCDWEKWLAKICEFCERGETGCYAENAFNTISSDCSIYPYDFRNSLCAEIDTPEDLAVVKNTLHALLNRRVYMCFSTDIVHSGHIRIIEKASRLGKLTVGVLSDSAIASYKRFPMLPCSERVRLFESIKGVSRVVVQEELSYASTLRSLKPDFLVHGDDWKQGIQQPVREEAIGVLAEYGGKLIEYPYSQSETYSDIEESARAKLSTPDMRRGRLRRLLSLKKPVTTIEAHSGITGLIAEKTVVMHDGGANQFDAMWLSSLCDSTAKGKPDIELVDMSSRLRTVDDIMEVTTKPLILDGDTGGLLEHFVFNVRTLERIGVSAVIIEDKTGLKKNSLFGCEVEQTQAVPEEFAEKIAAGKRAQKTRDFMIIARIESLILEVGMEDALYRAECYVGAGADGIMIHSRKNTPDEVFEFARRFREKDKTTVLVVVPTAFPSVTESEFAAKGFDIVIYANQLTRSGFPAMERTAKSILENRRALEADQYCMPIKQIINLIPGE